MDPRGNDPVLSARREPSVGSGWPPDLPVRQMRVARPTNQLEEVIRFYRDALQLPVVGSFRAHAGYDGVMIGLPGTDVHLEFTQHTTEVPSDAPSADHLLVLYVPDRDAIDRTSARLGAHGYFPVPPVNPFWEGRSITFPDPDGWRVVLVHGAGFESFGEPDVDE